MNELQQTLTELFYKMIEATAATITLGIVILPYYLVIKAIRKNKRKKDYKYQIERDNYYGCYQPRQLLTENEWYNYQKLKEYASKKNLIICPKVRLLDIIEPRNDIPDYTNLLNKIHARHVDFVICNQHLKIIAVLELDDNSHNTIEAQEMDIFKNQIITSVGYKMIRTRAVTETTLDILGY